VHLAQRRSGYRFFLELRKDLLRGRAELIDYPLPDLREIMGRDLVLQLSKLFDIFVR
jgi:hypothetical protein